MTEGPAFKFPVEIPVLPCTEAAKGYNFTIPEVIAEDQQELKFRLIHDEECSKMYRISGRNVTLVPEYEAVIASGVCPAEKDC